jgi:DNA-binding transcriptional LysR family regulator
LHRNWTFRAQCNRRLTDPSVSQQLYHEDFVIASRARHPFTKSPTLGTFCAAQHLLVSQSGDSHGFVDKMLAERGLSRRIALTVPNFMLALAVIAETDLIVAIPRHFLLLSGCLTTQSRRRHPGRRRPRRAAGTDGSNSGTRSPY